MSVYMHLKKKMRNLLRVNQNFFDHACLLLSIYSPKKKKKDTFYSTEALALPQFFFIVK